MNTQNDESISFTGGQSTFMNIGLDYQRKNWSAQVLYQQPIYQSETATK